MDCMILFFLVPSSFAIPTGQFQATGNLKFLKQTDGSMLKPGDLPIESIYTRYCNMSICGTMW